MNFTTVLQRFYLLIAFALVCLGCVFASVQLISAAELAADDANLINSSLIIPEKANPGTTIDVELNLDNSGGGIAETVLVTTTLPAEVTFIESSLESISTLTSFGQIELDEELHAVIWSGQIDINQNVRVSFDLELSETLVNGDMLEFETEYTAENNLFSKTETLDIVEEYFVYIPIAYNFYPFAPDAPELEITEDDGAEIYTLSWEDTAESYILEVDTDEDFDDDPEEVYSGPDTSYEVDTQSPGTYYFRYRAVNTVNGNPDFSLYSGVTEVVIDGFYVEDNEVDDDDCTTLHWDVDGIDDVENVYLRLHPLLDTIEIDEDGSEEVCPSEDTTYELIVVTEAEDDDDDDIITSYTELVTVDGDDCNEDPRFEEFRAVREANNIVEIIWDIECADAVELKAGDEEYMGVDGDSSARYMLNDEVTFKLRVTGDNDQTYTAQIEVDMDENYFYVDDTSITVGDCTTLNWNMSDILSIYTTSGKGYEFLPQIGEDSEEVCPSVDTTYYADVELDDGTSVLYEATVDVAESDTVECGDDPAILEFESDEDEVDSGDTVEISWEVTCTQTVEFRVGSGPFEPATGEETREFVLTKDTEFQLKLTAPDDNVYYSFELEVEVD